MKYIPLTQGKFAIVDDADFDRLNQFKWYANSGVHTFYAGRHTHLTETDGPKKTMILMHREILGLYRGDCRQTDHINHDGLDNRKSNLRICSVAENQHNQLTRKTGTSKYKGVYWEKDRGKWQADISCNGKAIHLGRYASEKDAAVAYNAKAIQLFGEFACLNIIE